LGNRDRSDCPRGGERRRRRDANPALRMAFARPADARAGSGTRHAVITAVVGCREFPFAHLSQPDQPLRTEGEETMTVKPLADRILVRRLDEPEAKRGGIIIPDTAKEKPQQGEVVATGPGRLTDEGKRVALEVKKGDKILMGKYSGTEVKIDGNEYLIMREDDVLAIVG
jgi:chaperonin GroES